MKLYYYRCETGNFGDDLNPWLWDQLIPDLLRGDEETLFVGIGTLLNHRLPTAPVKVIFGSGTGYGNPPPVDSTWHVYCVRGPHTAQRLGLDARCAITDAAALIATLDMPVVARDGGVAFMPHHDSLLNADWQAVCGQLGIRYIDPGWSVPRVLGEIRRSSTVLAEAMHGAIVADALRVPWVPVVCYPHILDFKWQDWSASLQLEYRPEVLPGIWTLPKEWGAAKRIRNGVKKMLIALGASGQGWTPPHPVSRRRQRQALLDALGGLAQRHSACLSDDRVFAGAVARLQDSLRRLCLDRRNAGRRP